MVRLTQSNDHTGTKIGSIELDIHPLGEDNTSLVWEPPAMDAWMEDIQDSKRWIVERFIPHAAICLISGPQKRAFKTWLADYLSILVSTGTNAGAFNVVEPGHVLYIEEEGQTAETRNRIQGLCKALGLEPADLSNIAYAFHERVKLNEPVWKERLEEYMVARKPVLVVLDALVYLHNCDENKTNEMLSVIDTIQMLRHHGASVLMLAHLNRVGEDKHADIDSQVRGSGVIVNAYDVHMALRRYHMNDPEIALTVRSRGSPERDYKVTWEIRNDENDVVQWAAPEILAIDDAVQLEEHARKCINKMLVGHEYTQTALYRLWRLSKGQAQRVQAFLLDRGELVEAKNKYRRVLLETLLKPVIG